MTVHDIPLASFFQRVVDPLIIMGMLYVCTTVLGQPFTGYSLVLMILAFFIWSLACQYINPYRTWRSGRMLLFARDIFACWAMAVLLLWLIGVASGLSFKYDPQVMVLWFVATPLVLLGSHLLASLFDSGAARDQSLRSVVLVGANDVSVRFATTL